MPLSWNASSRSRAPWFSCADVTPYITFDLMIAFQTCSFSLLVQSLCFQKSSSLLHVRWQSLILLLSSDVVSPFSFSVHPRYFAWYCFGIGFPLLKCMLPVTPKLISSHLPLFRAIPYLWLCRSTRCTRSFSPSADVDTHIVSSANNTSSKDVSGGLLGSSFSGS